MRWRERWSGSKDAQRRVLQNRAALPSLNHCEAYVMTALLLRCRNCGWRLELAAPVWIGKKEKGPSCYGLNAVPHPPKFISWSPNPHCDDMKRYGLWKVIGFRCGMRVGPSPSNGISVLKIKDTRMHICSHYLSLSIMHIRRGHWAHNENQSSTTQKRLSTRTWIELLCPDSKTLRNKCLLIKTPCLQ